MSRSRDQSGAVAVELALITPLLFILLAGVIDFGYAFLLKAQVIEAAEEAAVHAARYPQQLDEAKARAVDVVTAATLTVGQVAITCSGTGINRELVVVVDMEYEPLFDLVVNDLDLGTSVTSDLLSDETSAGCP